MTSPGAAVDSRPAPRLRSLDGLRGAAALIVLVHHALLLFPVMAAAYFPGQAPAPASGSLAWLLSYTPLHLVWAGTEGVYLFLVLSGAVLVLPVLARPDFGWVGYFPRRIIRLYGPVIAAVALGLVAYLIAPRFNDAALGPWVNGRPNQYPPSAVLVDVTILTGHSGRISPLWSLQWEVLFSLLLPLFVLFVTLGRRFDLLKAAGVLTVIALGSIYDDAALFYLPMFAVGALTAARWRTIEQWVSAGSARWRAFWPVIGLAAVLLTCARWELLALGVSRGFTDHFTFLGVPGVWLLVVIAWFCPSAKRLLEAPFWQWAGRISFSLYLVHEPVLLSCRFLTAPASPWVAIAIGIPCALVLAVLFERFVEARFHRLAQRVGRGVQSRLVVRQPA